MDKLYRDITKEVDKQLKEDPSFIVTVRFLQNRFRLGPNRAFDYAGKLKINGYNADCTMVSEIWDEVAE